MTTFQHAVIVIVCVYICIHYDSTYFTELVNVILQDNILPVNCLIQWKITKLTFVNIEQIMWMVNGCEWCCFSQSLLFWRTPETHGHGQICMYIYIYMSPMQANIHRKIHTYIENVRWLCQNQHREKWKEQWHLLIWFGQDRYSVSVAKLDWYYIIFRIY